MTNLNIVLCLIGIMLMGSCKPKQQKTFSLDSLISSELGPDAEITKNEEKSLLLAVAPVDQGLKGPSSERQQMKYLVVDIDEEKIIYNGGFEAGYVQWLDNQYIEVFSPPGIMGPSQNKNDIIKVIEVRTGEKMTKTLFLATKGE